MQTGMWGDRQGGEWRKWGRQEDLRAVLGIDNSFLLAPIIDSLIIGFLNPIIDSFPKSWVRYQKNLPCESRTSIN